MSFSDNSIVKQHADRLFDLVSNFDHEKEHTVDLSCAAGQNSLVVYKGDDQLYDFTFSDYPNEIVLNCSASYDNNCNVKHIMVEQYCTYLEGQVELYVQKCSDSDHILVNINYHENPSITWEYNLELTEKSCCPHHNNFVLHKAEVHCNDSNTNSIEHVHSDLSPI